MELYHLLPFILAYYVLNKFDKNFNIEHDPLFAIVPKMKIPSGMLYATSLLPLFILICKSEKFMYTEHTSIALSYYVFVKSVMYALGNNKQEPSYSLGICTISTLMLIYTGILPRDMAIIGYAMIAAQTYISLGSRKMSSDLLFFDILIAHLLFYFAKRAVVNVQ